MKYCKRCLNVDTRPNIIFNDDGLCYPCSIHEDLEEIDWDLRRDRLKEVVEFAKQNNSSGYDCIVGVSGGKDSTRQAFHIKDHFKLNPLLVSMNYPPDQISKRGVDNLSNLISNGFDCINISCSPITWKKAMKTAFFKYGNWAKSTELALFSSVPRVAIAYQIPLVFWGESPASAIGEMGTLGSDSIDGNKLKYSNTLAGGDISWLLEANIERKHILQYIYPSDNEMLNANLKIIFMDYFMSDFTSLANSNYAALNGLSIKKPNPNKEPDYFGTSMLDEDFININMYIRYLKFGFGRTSDIVNWEIRSGRMTRDEGISLVEKFDGNYDLQILRLFCEYIDISEKQFWVLLDTYVNKELFYLSPDLKYIPKFKVGQIN